MRAPCKEKGLLWRLYCPILITELLLCIAREGEIALQAEKEAGPPTEEERVGAWFSNPVPAAQPSAQGQGTGVGKYLNVHAARKAAPAASPGAEGEAPGPPAKKAKQASYGNFNAW